VARKGATGEGTAHPTDARLEENHTSATARGSSEYETDASPRAASRGLLRRGSLPKSTADRPWFAAQQPCRPSRLQE